MSWDHEKQATSNHFHIYHHHHVSAFIFKCALWAVDWALGSFDVLSHICNLLSWSLFISTDTRRDYFHILVGQLSSHFPFT